MKTQGLLRNLVVTEHAGRRGRGGKSSGNGRLRFAVAAGERRRRALLLLQSRDRLPRDDQVPCELVPPERALEVSVAENSGREPLHPADEFDAFKAMVDGGKGIEDVAARFGVSPLTVQRRLKLAALSPRLPGLYRQDGINLDQLMALTLSDDHAVQEANWFEAPHWEQSAAAIRRRLTTGEVEAARSGLARFVGVETYEAAGGVVKRDLFDSEQSRFFCDPALLQRLATEKLETTPEAVRAEGWNWVEVRLDVASHALRQFSPAEYDLRKPTPNERKELAELTRRSRELERHGDSLGEHHEGWADEAEAIDLEEQDIAARQRAIQHGLRVWAPAVKVLAGAIVTVSRVGDVEVIRGLVREADRRTLDAARRKAGKGRRGAASDEADGHEERRARRGGTRREAEACRVQRCLVPPVGCASNLGAPGGAGAQRARGPRGAGQLARPASARRRVPARGRSVADHRTDGNTRADLGRRRSESGAGLAGASDGVRRMARATAQERSAWLAWLLDLPQADLLELIALCTAVTVNALPSTGAAFEAGTLASAVGLDMADWWEPTAEGFLNHVSKAQIVQALREAGPGLAADGVETMKKDALVTTALARLKGTRWLPAPLRPVPG